MDNAARALLMAGMILLAMLTVTLFVYMSANLNTIGSAEADRKKAEELSAWNSEWEAYNKRVLYGAEVLTVVNKAKQNNVDYNNDSAYKVNVTIKGKSNSGTTITTSNIINYKKSIFECTKMEYSKTGRIKNIEFKLVEDLG